MPSGSFQILVVLSKQTRQITTDCIFPAAFSFLNKYSILHPYVFHHFKLSTYTKLPLAPNQENLPKFFSTMSQITRSSTFAKCSIN